MADGKKDEAKKDDKKAEGAAEGAGASPAASSTKSKTPVLVGGSVALVALGWIFSTMAVPHKDDEHAHHLEGPFVARLSKSELQVNLAGESSKRYLVMMLNGEYMAY